jgi:acetolactate decarboxylase
MKDDNRSTLINASVRASYLAGVYDGFISVGTLRAQGDFGLGADDRNNGELVMLDGRCYSARRDGSVVELPDDALVPFASVTRFRPDRRLRITGPMPRAAFEARLDAWLPGSNRMFALRVHGRFARVVAGASPAQTRPYRPFAEVYRDYHLIPRDGMNGTLVGFRMPGLLRDISKQGYHFHLLSDDRQAGGHVDDEVIEDVEVEAHELHGVEILVPDTAAFQGADLVLAGAPAR